ncbi:MAG TPA: HhH-GPD-type base excision DNA repair protein [Gaiellaceae bacterium]|jgi:uncharacterized HhH-GPD family protein|nr:HhH-GPD-type base excision DNA repair protein [Gaiellaceae bacterium]
MAAPDRLYFTDDDEACRLIASDGFALLVGFALDQQVTVPTAFAGPKKIEQRLGTIDPVKIAATDPAALEAVFREKPAVHRFPGAMAARVHELAATVAEEYDGKAERIWTEARDTDDLRTRIAALPGFGEMKIKALGAVLAKRFDVAAAQPLAPSHKTLGDVDSPQALVEYQAAKREYKAAQRAAKTAR